MVVVSNSMINIFLLIGIYTAFVYVWSLMNLINGKQMRKHKNIIQTINFLFLCIYIIGLISLGDSNQNSNGFIFIFVALIILAMIVLGIIGGFMFNPEINVFDDEKRTKRINTLKKIMMSTTIMSTFFIALILIVQFSRLH